MFVKIPNFQNFRRTGKYVVELYMEIEHANFQVDISISDKHIAQIAVSVDDVFFKTAIWSIYRHRTEVEIKFVEY